MPLKCISASYKEALLTSLYDLYTQHLYCDLELRCHDGDGILVHKSIVMAASNYLRVLVDSGATDSICYLTGNFMAFTFCSRSDFPSSHALFHVLQAFLEMYWQLWCILCTPGNYCCQMQNLLKM